MAIDMKLNLRHVTSCKTLHFVASYTSLPWVKTVNVNKLSIAVKGDWKSYLNPFWI